MTDRTDPPRTGRVPATNDPVARLMVDVPLAHLDRPFDYLVPAELDDQTTAGCRVRVRFAGRLVDGFVLERRADTDSDRALSWIERVLGAAVLTAETAALFRAVADRWAGSFVDVVRLGVPARHARAESAAPVRPGPPPSGSAADRAGWSRYRAGSAFLGAIAAGRAPRAVWSALPGEDWPARIADAVQAAVTAGRGAVVVVPDARDLARVDAAVTVALGTGRHVALSADLGPERRYRRWLAVRRGEVPVVVGTRAAAYAPVADPGLLVVWDDGDDLHVEPRAPYPHVRDVLVLRASLAGAAVLVAGHARTAEAQQLVDSGWARAITADRAALRAATPRIEATGDESEQRRDPVAAAARLPSLALRTARETLAAGRPVLVQVPRRGYVPALACVRDRTPARCPTCAGPLAAPARDAVATCRWCGRPAGGWTCPACGGRAMRAVVIGSGRTAEELGRALPGHPVRTSGAGAVLDRVDGRAALVVATPGAEPVADGGYGAALLLDGWALLSRADLRAGEETMRRWLNAAALVRPDGRVVIGADAGIPTVQALVRWDPAGHAARELAERAELGFPPAVRMASVTGAPDAVADLLRHAVLPPGAKPIGPVPAGGRPDGTDHVRLLIRVPRPDGAALARTLKAAAAVRSARKAPDPVRIALDPVEVF